MRVGIYTKGIVDLSIVRGVGSYVTMLIEAIEQFGDTYDIQLSHHHYDVLIHPGFFPYSVLELEPHIKNILVIHDLIPLKYPGHFPAGWRGVWKWFRNKYKVRSCAGVITDTEVVKKEITKYIGLSQDKIRVVYPAAKKLFYSSISSKIEDSLFAILPEKYVLYVGDVTWNKNLENLAYAVQKSNATLVLVGKALSQQDTASHPWQRSFKSFLEIVKNDKQFIFLGYVPDEQVMYLYQHALCTILPSYDEGFGLPWLEASLAGSPMVVSKIPVFEEITHGVSIYCDPHSVTSIAHVLEGAYTRQGYKAILQEQHTRAKTFSQNAFLKSFVKSLTAFI